MTVDVKMTAVSSQKQHNIQSLGLRNTLLFALIGSKCVFKRAKMPKSTPVTALCTKNGFSHIKLPPDSLKHKELIF